ncbi:hypothetical protein HF324_07995 [Chitinophaga oryzae]|uniref:Uncharacterized protein n=1 Tax=Chitinophaga oryzae TaxID=2725414 RepID=A0AAE6ZER3_9BACT|nr:hypothetical protein [Chitinophaga oryzae]QJB31310.1 hypothetical protein HF329_08335 [Chitinophaga oryzae]QJB37796.1 hypothetical protein HF324_07995 [Chitinophaga oryzae]
MKFLPIERYTLLTKLSREEIKARLEANVEPKSTRLQVRIGWSKPRTTKPYQGAVSTNGFYISRIINYRNSFLPEIRGEVSHEIVHTAVKIDMQVSWFVRVFMLFWFGAVVAGLVLCVGAIINGSRAGDKFDPFLLVPFPMLIFGYLLVRLSFQYEVNKSKKFLRDLLQGWEEGKA